MTKGRQEVVKDKGYVPKQILLAHPIYVLNGKSKNVSQRNRCVSLSLASVLLTFEQLDVFRTNKKQVQNISSSWNKRPVSSFPIFIDVPYFPIFFHHIAVLLPFLIRYLSVLLWWWLHILIARAQDKCIHETAKISCCEHAGTL